MTMAAWSQDALHAAGPQAAHIVDLWNLTVWISIVVFTAILAATAWAIWRSPRADAQTPPDVSGLSRREPGPVRHVIWAITISIVLLFVLLVASVGTDRALAALVLRDAVHIEVTSHQWWWSARYDDPKDASRMFTVANELHIPAGRPVILTLHSSDVIHSLWVPNLAGKKDLIPGRTATLTLRADKPGVYRGQCAEFCGAQHAWMAFTVTADPPEQYEKWANSQRAPSAKPYDDLTRRGQQVFMGSTCVMCHAIGGTEASGQQGPDLTHLASRRTLAAGTLPNDSQHLASWITQPAAHKPGVNMPAHAFSPEDLQALVAYLGSLQ
jgi:cytochrome c oxidase subunit II